MTDRNLMPKDRCAAEEAASERDYQVSSRTGDVDAVEAIDSTRPTHTISRRIGLPSGRAVVGALLVTVAVVGLFASYRSSQAETGSPYVVVANTIPAGQVVAESDLVVRLLDIGELGERTFTDPAQAVGSVAVQTLLPGQLLQQSTVALTNAGATSSFEVSFAIERSRALDGRLTPGEVVDVLATLSEGGDSCTTVVAPKARVIRVGSGGDQGLTKRSDFSVTLAVAQSEHVLAAVFAADEAEVTLVRATRVQDTALDGAYCGAPLVEAATTEGAAT
jgi:Flp pilus assembly protein CpaB